MVLSIDISESTAFAAIGKSKRTKAEVYAGREVVTKSGAITAGRIVDRAAFIQGINEFLATLQKRPTEAVVCLESKLFLNKEFTLPIVPEAELKLMVKNEMLQKISIDAKYTVDYTYIGRQGNMISVMAYAIQEEIVSELRSILRELNLKPIRLDVNSNSLYRLIVHSYINGLPIDQAPAIVAEIGMSTMTSNLFADGRLVIVRNAAVSIHDMERAMANLGRNITVADNIEELDFSPANLDQDILLYNASKRYLSSVVEQLVKIINYHATIKASDPVRRIFLYGSISMIKGLPDYLSSALNIPVYKIESIDKVVFPSRFPLASAINCIGTILDR